MYRPVPRSVKLVEKLPPIDRLPHDPLRQFRGELMSEPRLVAAEVTPPVRPFASLLRTWRGLPGDEKGNSPSYWKRGIQDPVDEGAR